MLQLIIQQKGLSRISLANKLKTDNIQLAASESHDLDDHLLGSSMDDDNKFDFTDISSYKKHLTSNTLKHTLKGLVLVESTIKSLKHKRKESKK